ncbi:MAG: rRNA ((1402)-2-O)-methyltransferase [Acidimicrobiaceae bacterium]|nr:rRNA ((1402)-2-O)-methyltransferase [Acidimicrobiaceae bacterium]
MTPWGQLVLVATPIGNLGDLAPRAVAALAEADLVACEDTRHSGRLLAAAGIKAKRLTSLHGHNEAARIDEVLELLSSGGTVALISDAGTPLVSDPGARLVEAAARSGAVVSTIPGPSAVLAALVVSGLGTSHWRFEGFLPRKGSERRERLARLACSDETSVCYESPRRVAATLAELAEVCGPDRRVCVARELTKLHEEVWRGTLGEAVARAVATEARGEHVIVLDAAPAAEAAGAGELVAAITRLLEAGLARRDAAIAAEVLLGAAHRDAYSASLEAAGRPGGRDPGAPGTAPAPPVR